MEIYNNIKDGVTVEDVKRIFGNKDNAIDYLTTLGDWTYSTLKSESPNIVYDKVCEKWDYDIAKMAVRHISKKTKYSLSEYEKNSELYENVRNVIKNEYDGNKDWAFNVTTYDIKLTSTIRKYGNVSDGLNKHLSDVKKNYMIKSYNIYRSFLYEYYIVKHHDNILPTLSNNNGVDFYYDGKKFDLKNTSSVTEKFKIDHGDKWMRDALNNPKTVAKYLYENQNENRFGFNPRIFVVELEGNIQTLEQIENDCRNLNFGSLHKIDFDYMINGTKENFATESLVVFV